LVAVANPSDLAQRKPGGRTLAPIDVAAELQRARESLGGIAVTELAGQPPVTLDAILQHLRDDFDVLYLVCHGALVDQEPRLWLEDEHGAMKITAGKDLVDGLARGRSEQITRTEPAADVAVAAVAPASNFPAAK